MVTCPFFIMPHELCTADRTNDRFCPSRAFCAMFIVQSIFGLPDERTGAFLLFL